MNSEMHLAAIIERVWRYTWRITSSQFGDALGGHDRARLEEYLEAANGRQSMGCSRREVHLVLKLYASVG